VALLGCHEVLELLRATSFETNLRDAHCCRLKLFLGLLGVYRKVSKDVIDVLRLRGGLMYYAVQGVLPEPNVILECDQGRA
jgi:hypothetical protein